MFHKRIFLVFFLFFIVHGVYANTIRVALDYLITPHYTPLIVGIQKGIFKKYGLTIELIENVGSSQGCVSVDRQTADMAMVVEPQVYIQQHKGLSIEIIASFMKEPLEVMVSHVPLKDLKGKRIGHASSGNGFTKALIEEALQHQHMTMEDVELVYAHKDLKRLFLANFVDAIVNVYSTLEVTNILDVMHKEKRKLYMYPFSAFGVPHFYSLVIIARKDFSKQLVEKFYAALQEANEYVIKNPEESWNTFKTYRLELDTESYHQCFQKVVCLLQSDLSPPTEEHIEKLLQFLKKHHLMGS